MKALGDFLVDKVLANEELTIQIIKDAGYNVKDMFDFINERDIEKNYWLNKVGVIPSVQQLYDIGYSIYDLKIGYFTIHQVLTLNPKPELQDLIKNYALIDIINYTAYQNLTYILKNLPSDKFVFNVTGLNLDAKQIPEGYEVIGYELKDSFGDGWQGTEVYFNSVKKVVNENGEIIYTDNNNNDELFNDQLFIPDKPDVYVPLDINYSYGALNYFPFFTDSQYPVETNTPMSITGLLLIKQGSYSVRSSKDFNNYSREVEWNIIGQDGNILVPEHVDGSSQYEGVEFNGYMTILKSGCMNSSAVNYDETAEIDNGNCFIEGYQTSNTGVGILRLDLRNGGSVLGYDVI